MARAENKEMVSAAMRTIAGIARLLRKQKGWSQEELGKKIGFTGSAISAMETGAQPASDQMLEGLERELGEGSGIFEQARLDLRLEKYPRQFKDFALLEQSVVTLSSYSVLVIHGLFQTEAYARALIAGGYPPLPSQRVDELVEARMARKALFDRDPPALIELVLDEAVLRRPWGSRDIMREQLLHLAVLGQRPNVTLQVMPLDRALRGEHAGGRGGLTLVETPDHEHLVYLEPQDESLLISDPTKVSAYAHRYAKIQAQALGPDESLGLIERLAGEEQ
ncbi:helix-turn-helix transcriptional regulator [Streptomyces sp. SID3212]|uniref:helix-turn-helix domain-containing protein n=1 Tax=Streptomyces sp. SID3212 TaxID=2690259 RepID=UPI00136A54C1|nr:helix-turn-helix transcriptional regulator [Streptomyces sp. SID3212]MYV55434.1 helix-turn-helix domain-containing protein [Streptomyces sp. SID3212]